jgi:hypothetical protein
MSEQAYAQLWQAEVAGLQPLEMAVAGGHLAHNLAQVFIAGYQAAIRASFALNNSHWIAYVASEDRTPGSLQSAVTYDPVNATISGVKTWVAAVKNIDSLVVKVGQGAQARYLHLSVASPGVRLTPRPAGQFLADLSQGSVEFDQAPVLPEQQLDGRVAGQFRFLEPLYIYVAFLAFIKPRMTESGQVDVLLSMAAILAGADFQLSATAQQYALFDQGVQDCLRQFEAQATPASESWATDRRLIEMYSNGIQQRARVAE